jgi:hypothetical protein
MALIIQTSWFSQDGPRLLFFLTCAIAVFAVARWAGKKSEISYTVPPPANRSQWGFTVGTPKGFEITLREKNWKFLYSPAVFVFEKYDLTKIREAVVERIEIDSSIKPEDTSSIADRVG